jgi:tetratricopeptide (TPR) repeat protein
VLAFGVESARRVRDWRSDETLFASAVKTAPRSIKARSNLATVYLAPRTPQAARRALEVLEPVADHAHTFGPYLFAKAQATALLGDRARARDLLRAGLAQRADSAQTLLELGNLALAGGEAQEALRDFDTAARMRKGDTRATLGRAYALAMLGRHADAAEAWQRVVTSYPDSAGYRAVLAQSLLKAGRTAEAARVAQEGLARRRDPRLLVSLAFALVAGAEKSEVPLETAVRAVEAAPTKELLTALALVQARAGRQADALATRARVQDPALLARIDAEIARGAGK